MPPKRTKKKENGDSQPSLIEEKRSRNALDYQTRRQVEAELLAYRLKQDEIPTDKQLAQIIGTRLVITLTPFNIARLRIMLKIKSRRELQLESSAHKRNGAAKPSAGLAERLGLKGALETVERKQVLILEGQARIERYLKALIDDLGVRVD